MSNKTISEAFGPPHTQNATIETLDEVVGFETDDQKKIRIARIDRAAKDRIKDQNTGKTMNPLRIRSKKKLGEDVAAAKAERLAKIARAAKAGAENKAKEKAKATEKHNQNSAKSRAGIDYLKKGGNKDQFGRVREDIEITESDKAEYDKLMKQYGDMPASKIPPKTYMRISQLGRKVRGDKGGPKVGDLLKSMKQKKMGEAVDEVDEGAIGRVTRAIGNIKDKRTISKDDAARKEKRKSSFKARLKDANAENRADREDGLKGDSPSERIKYSQKFAARISGTPSDKAREAAKRIKARRIRQGAEDRRKANEAVDQVDEAFSSSIIKKMKQVLDRTGTGDINAAMKINDTLPKDAKKVLSKVKNSKELDKYLKANEEVDQVDEATRKPSKIKKGTTFFDKKVPETKPKPSILKRKYSEETNEATNKFPKWWEDDPRAVLTKVYHAKRQLPPKLDKKSWQKLVNALQDKRPAPLGEYRRWSKLDPAKIQTTGSMKSNVGKQSAGKHDMSDAPIKGFKRDSKGKVIGEESIKINGGSAVEIGKNERGSKTQYYWKDKSGLKNVFDTPQKLRYSLRNDANFSGAEKAVKQLLGEAKTGSPAWWRAEKERESKLDIRTRVTNRVATAAKDGQKIETSIQARKRRARAEKANEEFDQVDEKLNPQQRNLKRAAQIKTGGREHGGQAAVQKKAGGDKGSSSKVQGGKQSQFTGVRHDSSRGDKTGARRDRTRGTNPEAPTHDKGNQSERPDQTKDARKGGFGGAKSTTVQKFKQHKASVERAKNTRDHTPKGVPKEDRARRELKRELDARKKSLTKPKTESFDDVDLDEAKMGAIARNVKKGDSPYTVVAIVNNKVVDQDHAKIPDQVPALVRELKKEYPNAKISVEDRGGRVVHSEAFEAGIYEEDPIGSRNADERYGTVKTKSLSDAAKQSKRSSGGKTIAQQLADRGRNKNKKNANEEVEAGISEEVDGWVAMYNGKRLEIPNDGKVKGIAGAKAKAIKDMKVPKSKIGMLAIKPSINEVRIGIGSRSFRGSGMRTPVRKRDDEGYRKDGSNPVDDAIMKRNAARRKAIVRKVQADDNKNKQNTNTPKENSK
tara:strand:+ start:1010 stop:4276 length:3267 start_codon:yes stop_codon:yes gene_type:complete